MHAPRVRLVDMPLGKGWSHASHKPVARNYDRYYHWLDREKVSMWGGRGGQIRLSHPTLHVLREEWWEGSFLWRGRRGGVLEKVSGGAGRLEVCGWWTEDSTCLGDDGSGKGPIAVQKCEASGDSIGGSGVVWEEEGGMRVVMDGGWRLERWKDAWCPYFTWHGYNRSTYSRTLSLPYTPSQL